MYNVLKFYLITNSLLYNKIISQVRWKNCFSSSHFCPHEIYNTNCADILILLLKLKVYCFTKVSYFRLIFVHGLLLFLQLKDMYSPVSYSLVRLLYTATTRNWLVSFQWSVPSNLVSSIDVHDSLMNKQQNVFRSVLCCAKGAFQLNSLLMVHCLVRHGHWRDKLN